MDNLSLYTKLYQTLSVNGLVDQLINGYKTNKVDSLNCLVNMVIESCACNYKVHFNYLNEETTKWQSQVEYQTYHISKL